MRSAARAFAGVLTLFLLTGILLLVPTTVQHELLVAYGRGGTYSSFVLAGLIEAGPFFLIGGLAARCVHTFAEVRVLGPASFSKRSRALIIVAGWLGAFYGAIVNVSVLVVFLLYNFGGRLYQDDMFSVCIRLSMLVLFATVGGYIFKYSRRLRLAGASIQGGPCDVLVLRSFSDDAIELPRLTLARINRLWPFNEIITPFFDTSLFALLVEELGLRGNVVILGDPHEDLPTTGGLRPHFPISTEEWKAYVRECLLKSSLIVIVPGETRGLRWEMEAISSGGYLGKTIMLLPPPEDTGSKRRRAERFFETIYASGGTESSIDIDAFTTALAFDAEGKVALTVSSSKYYEDLGAALSKIPRS